MELADILFGRVATPGGNKTGESLATGDRGVIGRGWGNSVAEKSEILVAESHPLCREGLTALFARNLGFSVIHEASDFPTAMARIAGHDSIGVVTVDLDLPGLRNGEGLRDLRVRYPSVRVVVIAATWDRDLILDALSAGVHGYIPKDLPVPQMLGALRMVMAGRIYVPDIVSDISMRKSLGGAGEAVEHDTILTGRQYEVLSLLAAGRSNKEIARLLRIAEGTVKVHIAAAFRMLGVHNRVSAAAAMRARTMNDQRPDAYLPDLFGERREPMSLRRRNDEQVRPISTRVNDAA